MFDFFNRRNKEMAKSTKASKAKAKVTAEQVKTAVVNPEGTVQEPTATPVAPTPVEEVIPAVPVNELDDKVADKMGMKLGVKQYKAFGTLKLAVTPPPFSSDRALVNDMVAFSRENKVKLPRFTSDPTRIAKAIAEWED